MTSSLISTTILTISAAGHVQSVELRREGIFWRRVICLGEVFSRKVRVSSIERNVGALFYEKVD